MSVKREMSDELSEAEREVKGPQTRKINWAPEGENRDSAGTPPGPGPEIEISQENITKMSDDPQEKQTPPNSNNPHSSRRQSTLAEKQTSKHTSSLNQ